MHAPLYADKIQMQHRLFSELSAMFGKEVPLYDKALLINQITNRAVCTLLGRLYPGFEMSDQQLDKTSGERHGAIRIGRPDEYRWISRFFAAFAMEPHNFYDMTTVGSKSQPIIATAFRAVHNPEHRVFTSLLQTTWFDPEIRKRIEDVLASRQVFSENARRLIELGERQGGLDWNDAEALIREGTQSIFKWTGKARDHALYKDLCDAGFKIAADIACFESHHLNHLTPNTLCMDLYTSAMKFCMGELTAQEFKVRAERALTRLSQAADRDWMRLHFKHLSYDEVEAFPHAPSAASTIAGLVAEVAQRLSRPDADLKAMKHAGFKDLTEGPSQDTPVLLRQDSYKALTEPVEFTNTDGTKLKTTHTARFGEIEQRFYATTTKGRGIYDAALESAETEAAKDPNLPGRDFAAYEARYAASFSAFPKTLAELLDKGLVFGMYAPTKKGIAARGTITTTDPRELVRQGHARVEGLRYEDFLPVSAAGIFASNLNQYGTKSTAIERPKYTQAMLEEILGKPIISTDDAYKGAEARSLLDTYEALGLSMKVDAARKAALETAAESAPMMPPRIMA